MAHQVKHLPSSERVAFIFDEQHEFQGRAKSLFDSVKTSVDLDFVPRLGGIAFVDSASHTPVQAADFLAYEARRYFIEQAFEITPREERWQWRRLIAKEGAVIVRGFDAGAIEGYARLLEGSR